MNKKNKIKSAVPGYEVLELPHSKEIKTEVECMGTW